ncbi:cytochrome c1 [Luteimonas terricola]
MTLISRAAGFAAAMLLSFSALAAAGGPVQHAGTDLGDTASLQRGAQLYMNYCSACHSLKYLRYSRMAEDLGLTEDEVMENLNFTGAKFGEQILTAMPAEGAAEWFGTVPPDLSLTSRVRGGDWIFSYLKSFHIDESRPLGWNNTVFPNASMPNVLWELQGIQQPVYGGKDEATGEPLIERLEISTPGSMNPVQFDQAVRDITAFLEYAGEPIALKRQAIGVWVMLFLAFFTFLAWLLKKEYWKDVH